MSQNASSDSQPLVLGIDLGGTSAKIGVCRGEDIIFKDQPVRTSDHDGADALLEAMLGRIKALQQQFPGIAGVGVGVPGFVDSNSGLVHELTNIPGWHEVYLAKLIREATGLPAVAENDANCMGLAELYFGAARGLKHFIAITLGTGVGGAVFIDGKLFHGARGGAGEVGQMSIDYRGVPGPHGNTGALERYVGNRQVAGRAAELYAAAGRQKSAQECSPAALAAAAGEGDAIALAVWDEFTTQLACGLSHGVWLLNPEAIVIGGGLAAAGDLVFKPLREKLNAQLATVFRENLFVIPAHFGNEAGIIGAASLIEV